MALDDKNIDDLRSHAEQLNKLYTNLASGPLKDVNSAFNLQRDNTAEINRLVRNSTVDMADLLKLKGSIANFDSKQLQELVKTANKQQEIFESIKAGNPITKEQLDDLIEIEKVLQAHRNTSKELENIAKQKLEIERQYGDLLKKFTFELDSLAGIAQSAFSNPISAALILLGGLFDQGKRFWGMTMDASKTLNMSLDTTVKLTAESAKEAGIFSKYLTEDILNATIALNKELRGNLDISRELKLSVAEMAVEWHMPEAEAARLLVTMKNLPGATDIAAKGAQVIAKNLGESYNVNPSMAMKSIAANSETASRYSKGMGENLVVGAIAASKLSIEFQSIMNAVSKVLDFESSITAEMEASVLMGKAINLERARAFAYDGQYASFVGELANQFGDISKMDPFQRDAAAAAAGMSVDQLSALLNNYKKYGTELQQLSKEDQKAVLEGQKELSDGVDSTSKASTTSISSLKNWGSALLGAAASLSSIVGPFASYIAMKKTMIALDKTEMAGGANKMFSSIKTPTSESPSKLTGSLKSLGNMPWGKLLTNFAIGAAAMAVLAGGVLLMGKAFQQFNGIDWSGVAKGMVGMVAFGAAAFGFGTLITSTFGVAGGVFAIGVLALTGALASIGLALQSFPKAAETEAAFSFMNGFASMDSSNLATMATGLTALIKPLEELTPHLKTIHALSELGGKAITIKTESDDIKKLNDKMDALISVIQKGGDVYLDKDKVGKSLTVWGYKNAVHKGTGASTQGMQSV